MFFFFFFFFFFFSQNRFRDVLGKLTTPIDGPFNVLIVLFACCHFVWIRGSNALIMFVCVEVLRSSQPMGSCRARSVYLTTRLLGRLSPLQHCAHSFARSWQLAEGRE